MLANKQQRHDDFRADQREAVNSTDNQQTVRRLPVIAALMSASLPGFGQLYNGQLNRGAWIFMIFAAICIPLTAAIALWLPVSLTAPMLLLGVMLAVVVWVYSIVDAWRSASDGTNALLRPWQTSSLYVSVFVLCNLIVLPTLALSVRTFLVAPFSIPSHSMNPTVLAGDFIFANMAYNCPGCAHRVKRGDIAILVNPNNRNLFYIKRVIGLPGDEININNQQLFINGNPASDTTEETTAGTVLVREYTDDRSWSAQWRSGSSMDFSTTVEPGHVLVLGDNRDESEDSRQFGQVPLADLKGLARKVWFSRSDNGIRWNRIGLDLTQR
jgi:signal peptidase I